MNVSIVVRLINFTATQLWGPSPEKSKTLAFLQVKGDSYTQKVAGLQGRPVPQGVRENTFTVMMVQPISENLANLSAAIVIFGQLKSLSETDKSRGLPLLSRAFTYTLFDDFGKICNPYHCMNPVQLSLMVQSF